MSGLGLLSLSVYIGDFRGRRIDWASIGQPAPPTPDGVTYLPLMEPAEGSVVTPRVLPPSIAAATAETVKSCITDFLSYEISSPLEYE